MKELFKKRFALTDQGASDLIKASIASFFVFFVNLIPAILLMLLLDHILLSHVRSNSFYYMLSGIILVLMYMLLNIEYNATYNATYRESENLRIDIARRLSNLPLSYFSKHNLSDLAQTIMTDVSAIEHALSHAVGKIIGFIFFFIVLSFLLLSGNVKLGLSVLAPIILYFLFIFISKKIQVSNQTKYYHKLRANSESFQEAIELQQEIKSYDMSEYIGTKLSSDMEDSEKIHIRSEVAVIGSTILSSLVLYLTFILIVIVGSHMYARGEISILYLIGYLLASIKLKEATEGIGNNMVELFYIDAMIQRINEIRTTVLQEGDDTELTSFDIEFSDVSFSYDKDTEVLKNISFIAKQNEVTALVGKSGCGKTSILRLVSRLYDNSSGLITISGRDIKTISTRSLFANISIVFQDVTLFNSSILENIRIGDPSARDEDVKRAAALANCDEFVNKLPEGYNTLIGENGASLSGGERQRISIARAFLKNAPIIILDEIAASLDVENEQKIQESLNKLTKNKTVLIISHRLKSIQNVDEIVVIDGGRIESIGSHAQLMQSSTIYKELLNKTDMAEAFTY